MGRNTEGIFVIKENGKYKIVCEREHSDGNIYYTAEILDDSIIQCLEAGHRNREKALSKHD